MLRVTALIAILSLAAAEANAQPAEETTAPPDRAGHESVALGMALVFGGQGGGQGGTDGGSEGIELFAGWAFGRVAVMGWLRGRRRIPDVGFFDLGLAARAWLFAHHPRIYAELHGGRDVYSISGDSGDLDGEGVVAGGGFGLELLSQRQVTIDARLMVDRGIIADHEDYNLVTLGVGLHFY
jgi:hypothetical protein